MRKSFPKAGIRISHPVGVYGPLARRTLKNEVLRILTDPKWLDLNGSQFNQKQCVICGANHNDLIYAKNCMIKKIREELGISAKILPLKEFKDLKIF